MARLETSLLAICKPHVNLIEPYTIQVHLHSLPIYYNILLPVPHPSRFSIIRSGCVCMTFKRFSADDLRGNKRSTHNTRIHTAYIHTGRATCCCFSFSLVRGSCLFFFCVFLSLVVVVSRRLKAIRTYTQHTNLYYGSKTLSITTWHEHEPRRRTTYDVALAIEWKTTRLPAKIYTRRTHRSSEYSLTQDTRFYTISPSNTEQPNAR